MNDLTNWYRDAFYKLEPLRWHLGQLTEAANTANNLAPYTVIPLHKVAAAEDVNNKADEFFAGKAVRADMINAAFDEWQEKTEWVQQTATYDELGMHRADILKQRIAVLEAKLQEASREINQLEKQCYALESDVEDAYRQLNYED